MLPQNGEKKINRVLKEERVDTYIFIAMAVTQTAAPRLATTYLFFLSVARV